MDEMKSILSLRKYRDDSFNREKFKQVLHYIIHKCGHLENVGKTVLFKLLYFAEFDYYELYEEKLTGETYLKFDHGPVPRDFEEVVKELEKDNKVVRIRTKLGKYEQQKFLSEEEPDLSLLSAKELNVIEKTIARYSSMNATQISAHSHLDMPYKATEDDDVIDYELVFYRDELFSVREYEDDEP